MWDADERLREELTRVRRSLDAQLREREPRLPRPARAVREPQPTKPSWEEIVREHAITPEMIPPSPCRKSVPSRILKLAAPRLTAIQRGGIPFPFPLLLQ